MTRGRVVVVGGGPAGASAAWHLARAGVEVTVLERAHFPRDKPCAEYLGPGAVRLLASMGVLRAVEAAGAVPLAGMTVRAPGGAQIRGRFTATAANREPTEGALALRRTVLDALLLQHARAAGADVREGVRVTGVRTDGSGSVTGVQVLEGTRTRALAADLVIGADGLRSVVARRLGLLRTGGTPRRIAVVAHFRGAAGLGEAGEMHVEADGYCGLANVGAGESTFSLVVPAARAGEISGDASGFLRRWIAARPQLATRYAHATLTDGGRVRTTGPFATRVTRGWAPGALLVGDAAGYFDPFTGEGIHRALRGSELQLPYALEAMARGAGTAAGRRALAAGARARRREFLGSAIVERLIAMVVSRPALIDRAAHVLARRQDMADLLVAVTGDLMPARAVLRPGYLLTLLVGGLALDRSTT